MSIYALAALIVLFFVTTAVGVITGSNSLITVPVMFQFGIDEKVAVATNMFGLTFMAVGATIPFVRAGKIEVRPIVPLIFLTAAGSAIGAALVGLITNESLKLIVSIAMFAVVIFTLINRNSGVAGPKAKPLVTLTYILTFLLAIYGGLYSGGYVTILTVVLIGFFGMTYAESIAGTKLINVFSSGVATAVFMWQGLVDYRLGAILGITMFAGAYFGAYYVTKINDIWLRRIFLGTVVLLAAKTLYDLFA